MMSHPFQGGVGDRDMSHPFQGGDRGTVMSHPKGVCPKGGEGSTNHIQEEGSESTNVKPAIHQC